MDKNSLIVLRDALTRLDLSVVQDLISDVVMRSSKKAAVVIDNKSGQYHLPNILYLNYSSLEDLSAQLIKSKWLLEHPILEDFFDLHFFFKDLLLNERRKIIVEIMRLRYKENKLLILQDLNDKKHGSYTVKIFYGPEIVGIDFWRKITWPI